VTIASCQLQSTKQLPIDLIPALDLGPRVLRHFNSDGLRLTDPRDVVENVDVAAIFRFVIGRHAHTDGKRSIGAHRAPIGLVTDRAWVPALHSDQFLRRRFFPLSELILRYFLLESLRTAFPLWRFTLPAWMERRAQASIAISDEDSGARLT